MYPKEVPNVRYVEVKQYGGPDVLQVVEGPAPAPGHGQALVDIAASGVNYMDVYQREGAYRVPAPFALGTEGAGRVRAVGDGVDTVQVGDRVAWKLAQGSYAEQVVVSAAEAVPVPDGVSDEVAAAVMLQGLTAHYLAVSTYPVQPGDTVLVHAAAGGVGLLLTQMVKLRGGRVIATVSTAAKEEQARGAGADEVIRYDSVEVAPAVKELTGGEGVAAVYDGVGKTTFDASLASLRPRGTMVIYGAASGPVPPFDVQRLNAGGSLFLTRPTLGHYTRDRAELTARTDELFGWIADDRLEVFVGGRYPLTDVRRAHEDLEGRRTTGKLLLLPG
ncbi:MAG: quinone oxidoreductase [Mycobacteriales bacterium]